MTDKQTQLIGHSLGVNVYPILAGKKKKLPTEDDFYRNYFCTSKNADNYESLKELVELGWMYKWEQKKVIYFAVTDLGKEKFIEALDGVHND